MNNYKEIELDYKARESAIAFFEKVINEPQMSEFESAFISGLIKQYKPKTVIEIGVAAGGSTAIILESLESYCKSYKLYSFDLNLKVYGDSKNSIGYLCNQYKKNRPLTKGSHELIYGKYAPESIELIESECDFMIIDTAHVLPGEILDFLAFYPILNPNAIVVLHDAVLNHLGTRPDRQFATKILFDVISAEKFVNFDKSNNYFFPNIVAFQLNSTSRNSLIDVISSLSITWEYLPSEYELQIYDNEIRKHYSPMEYKVWQSNILFQKASIRKMNNHTFELVRYKGLIWFIIKFFNGFYYLRYNGLRRYINRLLFLISNRQQ